MRLLKESESEVFTNRYSVYEGNNCLLEPIISFIKFSTKVISRERELLPVD